jgi:hypothetical protein
LVALFGESISSVLFKAQTLKLESGSAVEALSFWYIIDVKLPAAAPRPISFSPFGSYRTNSEAERASALRR